MTPDDLSPAQKIDLEERIAIRVIDGGDDLVCDVCGRQESAPFDVGDECCCGGVFREFCELVDPEEAAAKAKEEIRKWREG